MKSLLIVSSLALLLLTNSCQDFNSNTNDEFRFSEFDLTTPLGKSMQILTSKCATCHENNYHGHWFQELWTSSRSEWVSQSQIVEGDFTGSHIINQLQQYNGTMPKGAASLSVSELKELCGWIQGSDSVPDYTGCPGN